ncbi:MAG: DUF3037 domain-containing protein [Acidobacteria bacterium]|nr:DUF3037 domain-containing protein [Acidobacteriota bacterium]MBS1866589.1 DUF3037 domain-containing protein [Acidobacteriota bacterium]
MTETNVNEHNKTYAYHVLRYASDIVRDEWLNIGILLFDPSTGERRLRLIEEEAEFARVRRLQPAADESVLRRLRDHLDERFDFSLEQLRSGDRSSATGEDLLELIGKWDGMLSTGLQLSPQKGLHARDLDQELERLYAEHVAPQRAAARAGSQSSRATLRTYCSQVWHQARLWERIEKSTRVAQFTFPGDPMRIDYSYRRNGTRGFVQTLSVSRAPMACKEYAYTAQYIAPRAAFKSEFAAVTDIPLDDNNLRHRFVRDTLRDAGIEPIPMEGFAVWVAKLKPMLQ